MYNQDSQEQTIWRRIGQQDVIPKAIKQRHIDGMIIFRGLAADRPTNNPITDVFAYFATDTNVLSIWNNTAWKSVTLT